MDRLTKTKALKSNTVNIEADIDLINTYSQKVLEPEEVFAFEVVLCDNEVDRDYDEITSKCLEELAPMFIGKTGIFNHSWDAKDQIARIYKAEVVPGKGKTQRKEPKKLLVATAYMLRTKEMEETIEKIEGGILKEVSIGFSINKSECSICGAEMRFFSCENGHFKGEEYDGEQCVGKMVSAADAYEFSFVAVPAQRGAGVKKEYTPEEVKNALITLKSADLTDYAEEIANLLREKQKSVLSEDEQAERSAILERNKIYLNTGEKENDTL